MTGIYSILNLDNNKRYVGSSARSLKYRLKKHRRLLKRGRHPNRYLQAAWNKYGERLFEFSILEYCEPDICVEREQYWMDFYRAYNRDYGYNLSPKAGSCLGIKHSEECKKKVSDRMRGIKQSEEQIRNRVESWKKTVMSPEGNKRWRQVHTGRVHSEETRKKIGDAHLGVSATEEQRKNMVEVWKKRKPPLTEIQILTILLLSSGGWSQRRIARKIGIHQAQVSKVIRRKYTRTAI